MKTINIRIDEKLKKQASEIFEEFGFDMTTAITMYLKAVVRTQSIPFNFEIPNKNLIKAMNEANDILSNTNKSKKYKSASDLRKDLNV